MRKHLKELADIADAHGVSVDDLILEKEFGAKVDKPFTLAIQFARLKDLVDFVNKVKDDPNTCVWQADSLDGEFDNGGRNRFVLRGHGCSKQDSLRVTNPNGTIVGTEPTGDCPRCGGFIPNNLEPGAYPGAISRLDNETEICSSCGVDEAILQFAGSLQDWRK